jgi:glucosamine 6-phosphate synthetase-like amidotransferase/phosphosugar isomerase protein
MIATVDHSIPTPSSATKKSSSSCATCASSTPASSPSPTPATKPSAELADHTVFVVEMREPLLAICETIPLQLLSYWMAINNGIDVDHPSAT